jgi:hypothetical protein
LGLGAGAAFLLLVQPHPLQPKIEHKDLTSG